MGTSTTPRCVARRAVKPEWWTLAFARPRGCPPPYQCFAPWYFDRFLFALNGGNLSLNLQIVSFLRVLWLPRCLPAFCTASSVFFLCPTSNFFFSPSSMIVFRVVTQCFSKPFLAFVSVRLCLLNHMISFSLRHMFLIIRDGILAGSASGLVLSRHVQDPVQCRAWCCTTTSASTSLSRICTCGISPVPCST